MSVADTARAIAPPLPRMGPRGALALLARILHDEG